MLNRCKLKIEFFDDNNFLVFILVIILERKDMSLKIKLVSSVSDSKKIKKSIFLYRISEM